MELMKIRKNYQVTIPRNLRNKFNLAEGDYVEIDTQGEFIILKPVKVIQPDQEYFFTKEWQKKEAEADEDIRRGDVLGPFDNAADAIKALKTAKI
ncbi:transcriptional regulator, AbrB family [delta proteobacterium NaphS2]|nr:transcriptional regulator, AbrB family [delta proteobacterium NaphS2]